MSVRGFRCLSLTFLFVSALFVLAGCGGGGGGGGGSNTPPVETSGAGWNLRMDGTPLDLGRVAFGNGIFVSPSSGGHVLTSQDGVTWTIRKSGTTRPLTAAAFGNGIFVAVGKEGAVVTSGDGAAWTVRDPQTTGSFADVVFGNGVFVALASGETTPSSGHEILRSVDGITWTSTPVGSRFLSVAFGNGIFVAVGEGGAIVASADARTWTPGDSGTSATLERVVQGNSFFVASGDGLVLTSSDGFAWTNSGSKTFSGMAFGNGRFYAVQSIFHRSGLGYWCTTDIYDSIDGASWKATASVSLCGAEPMSFANESLFLSGTDSSGHVSVPSFIYILQSPDGTRWASNYLGWSYYPSYPPPFSLSGAAFGNGVYLVSGSENLLTSPDGAVWSYVPGTDQRELKYRIVSSAFGAGLFAAVTEGGIIRSPDGRNWEESEGGIITSPDGRNWEVTHRDAENRLSNVAFLNGLFVGVGSNGTILTSSDGRSWTLRNRDARYSLAETAFGNGVFVAVGSSGAVLTSGDGVLWTLRNTGRQEDFSRIVFGNGIFILNDRLVSNDGVTWNELPPSTLRFTDMAFGRGFFVAVNDEKIYSSTDGVAWSESPTPNKPCSSEPGARVFFANNTFITLCGQRILQSDPL